MCAYFAAEGYEVHGLDNNQRAVFFGPAGDTRWNQARLEREVPGFVHHELDIRDRAGVLALVGELRPAAIVHTAAQPSHDRAAAIPFDDFDTNAVGTLNLLEAARRSCPESPFVHLSTNKVYGDRPNAIRLEGARDPLGLRRRGVRGGHPGDASHRPEQAQPVRREQGGGRRHGPGVRPLLRHADLLPARGLPDRAEPRRGRAPRLPELPGQVQPRGREYRVFGYKGKQVRDNIHSRDVARFAHEFIRRPRGGEVYNLGGGKANSCSVLEAFRMAEELTGRTQVYTYVEENRIGDHIVLLQRPAQDEAALPVLGRPPSRLRRHRLRDRRGLARRGSGVRILIAGACGFVGSTLARTWVESAAGHKLSGSTASPGRAAR